MGQKSNSYDIKNDDFTLNNEDSDYKNLVNRLKEIRKLISLLRKNI